MSERSVSRLWVGLLVLLLPLAAQAYDGAAVPISATEGSSRVVAVAAGGYHSCALKANGEVQCWGMNTGGQAPPPGPFMAITAGGYHTCGLRVDGAVDCWGSNDFGQAADQPGPFVAVSSGSTHTCALRSNGEVVCWGLDASGQSSYPPGQFIAVSAADIHSCGVRADGSATCWGENTSQQTSAPGGHFVSVSTGGYHSCGLKADGAVDCWGAQSAADRGQAADPAGHYLAVTAGSLFSCGLKVDGSIHCWGETTYGQAADQPGPFVAVSAGHMHACGLKADGSVACWGAGGPGMTFGPPDFAPHFGQSTVPAALAAPGAVGFGQLAAGNVHACQVRRDGTTACWGANGQGQATPSSGTFTQVATGDAHSCAIGSDGKVTCWGQSAATNTASFSAHTYRQLALGSSGRTCATRADNLITDCTGWGPNPVTFSPEHRAISQTGGKFCLVDNSAANDPARALCFNNPSPGGLHAESSVSGPWQRVEAGLNHVCGLKTDGTLACWGSNADGQTSNVPTGRFRALSTGYNHACAIREDGTLACWGGNNSGQADAPAGTYVQVVAGNTFSCAIRGDGVRTCWGDQMPQPTLTALPGGTAGVAYAATLSMVSADYVPPTPAFVVVSGELPPGLVLSAAGGLSGMPTTVGSYTFNVEGEDANGFVATREYVMAIADGTAPEIAYAFIPASPDGDNGWYVGNVGIDWTVSDAESAISASIGCEDNPAAVTSDTPGASLTCTATSAGGENSVTTTTIKRDATAPTITATEASVPDGSNGWYRSNASVAFSCSDNLSGVASCPANQTLGIDGAAVSSTAHTIQDNAGNASAPSNVVTVKIDKTAPTLSPTVPNPLLRGQSYSASPNASDATSGVASASCGALDTSALGSKSTTCTATDNAGNSKTVTLNYTVTTTCSNDGYTGTQLTWCRNICEMGYTGSTLNMWIRRWIDRYHDDPYCRVQPQPQ